MEDIFETLQGHRCVSTSVWSVAIEKLNPDAENAERVKFYSDVFYTNFSTMGIYMTDWPILGAEPADLYAIYHAIRRCGGFFAVVSKPQATAEQIAATGVHIVKKDHTSTLSCAFQLLGWESEALLAAKTFISAFSDVYIRYLLVFEQCQLAPASSGSGYPSQHISQRVLRLVRMAWQGAYLRPALGGAIVDNTASMANYTPSSSSDSEDQSTNQATADRDDSSQQGSSKTKRQGSLKARRSASSPDNSRENTEEHDAAPMRSGRAKAHGTDGALAWSSDANDNGKQPMTASTLSGQHNPLLPHKHAAGDAHRNTFRSITAPQSSHLTVPLINYTRAGLYVGTISTNLTRNFDEAENGELLRKPVLSRETRLRISKDDDSEDSDRQDEKLSYYKRKKLERIALENEARGLDPQGNPIEGLQYLRNTSLADTERDGYRLNHAPLRSIRLNETLTCSVSDPIRGVLNNLIPSGTFSVLDRFEDPLPDTFAFDTLVNSGVLKEHVHTMTGQAIASIREIHSSFCRISDLLANGSSTEFISATTAYLTFCSSMKTLFHNILEISNVVFNDYGTIGGAESALLSSPDCLLLLYSLLSDDLEPLLAAAYEHPFSLRSTYEICASSGLCGKMLPYTLYKNILCLALEAICTINYRLPLTAYSSNQAALESSPSATGKKNEDRAYVRVSSIADFDITKAIANMERLPLSIEREEFLISYLSSFVLRSAFQSNYLFVKRIILHDERQAMLNTICQYILHNIPSDPRFVELITTARTLYAPVFTSDEELQKACAHETQRKAVKLKMLLEFFARKGRFMNSTFVLLRAITQLSGTSARRHRLPGIIVETCACVLQSLLYPQCAALLNENARLRQFRQECRETGFDPLAEQDPRQEYTESSIGFVYKDVIDSLKACLVLDELLGTYSAYAENVLKCSLEILLSLSTSHQSSLCYLHLATFFEQKGIFEGPLRQKLEEYEVAMFC